MPKTSTSSKRRSARCAARKQEQICTQRKSRGCVESYNNVVGDNDIIVSTTNFVKVEIKGEPEKIEEVNLQCKIDETENVIANDYNPFVKSEYFSFTENQKLDSIDVQEELDIPSKGDSNSFSSFEDTLGVNDILGDCYKATASKEILATSENVSTQTGTISGNMCTQTDFEPKCNCKTNNLSETNCAPFTDDMSKQIAMLSYELRCTKQDLQDQMDKSRQLEAQLHNREKDIDALNAQIKVLQQSGTKTTFDLTKVQSPPAAAQIVSYSALGNKFPDQRINPSAQVSVADLKSSRDSQPITQVDNPPTNCTSDNPTSKIKEAKNDVKRESGDTTIFPRNAFNTRRQITPLGFIPIERQNIVHQNKQPEDSYLQNQRSYWRNPLNNLPNYRRVQHVPAKCFYRPRHTPSPQDLPLLPAPLFPEVRQTVTNIAAHQNLHPNKFVTVATGEQLNPLDEICTIMVTRLLHIHPYEKCINEPYKTFKWSGWIERIIISTKSANNKYYAYIQFKNKLENLKMHHIINERVQANSSGNLQVTPISRISLPQHYIYILSERPSTST